MSAISMCSSVLQIAGENILDQSITEGDVLNQAGRMIRNGAYAADRFIKKKSLDLTV